MTALAELPVLLIDVQATGASPEHGHILELGWTATQASGLSSPGEIEVTSRLIQLPTGAKLPWRVAELTGIRARDLKSADPVDEAFAELLADGDAITEGRALTPAVMHCARFEQSFLEPLHARLEPGVPFPLLPLCTLEIARRLLPDIPRRGLRALAGYFGHATGQLRRADSHVRATAVVWKHLVRQLALRGIQDLAALRALLEAPAPRRSTRRIYPMPRETRLCLPDTPGVYRMLRTSGDVLYAGKATSIRRRVNSYFQKQSDLSERMLELLSQARDIAFTPTPTALEAALLESDQIKKYEPPYNVALRGEGRSAWFAAHGLLDLAPCASRRHRMGPLGSPWWVQRLWGLWSVLESDTLDEPGQNGLANALGPSVRTASREVLEDGIAAFKERIALHPHDPRYVLALGTAQWRENLDADPPSIDEAEDEGETEWTAAAVAEGLADIVVAVAHALRRARWLRQLSQSSVAWREDGRWNVLLIDRGTVVDRQERPAGADLPPPPGFDRPLKTRRWSFDIGTFDRLRVLTTELRRVVQSGREAEVYLEPCGQIAGKRLRRILRSV